MNSEYLQTLCRHSLTAVGGFLVARGVTDNATVESIAGGAVALIGLVWSVFHKQAIIAKDK